MPSVGGFRARLCGLSTRLWDGWSESESVPTELVGMVRGVQRFNCEVLRRGRIDDVSEESMIYDCRWSELMYHLSGRMNIKRRLEAEE